MEVRFRKSKTWVDEFTVIYFEPIGWKLCNHDARTIVPAFQQIFETDFRVHCDEEGQDYSTSYDSVRNFLARANLEENHINRISCVIPIHGNYYDVSIDSRENTISIFFSKPVESKTLLLFDPAMQRISRLLSQDARDSEYSFHKRIKKSQYDHHRPSAVEFIFHHACREKHDMMVLKAFDQRYHLSTIYTEVWDQERHFWLTFEGFQQYMEEAPTDPLGFYEYLDELSFVILIDEIRYRVWVQLGDNLSLLRIVIEFDGTDQPYDFTPVMEELERQILR